jgi:hypothetical protein
MGVAPAFPAFDIGLTALNQFILELVDVYQAGRIRSWDDLEEEVNSCFTPERMEYTETLVPGWRKMASYMEGVTLVHVMCVLLGPYMMPEFLRMTYEQLQTMKWAVPLHDLEKEPQV